MESDKIRWNRGSIQELKQWLNQHADELDTGQEDEHVLDFPWPVNIESQRIIFDSAKSATVQATLGFDDVAFAEDYEIRITLLKETPLVGAGVSSPTITADAFVYQGDLDTVSYNANGELLGAVTGPGNYGVVAYWVFPGGGRVVTRLAAFRKDSSTNFAIGANYGVSDSTTHPKYTTQSDMIDFISDDIFVASFHDTGSGGNYGFVGTYKVNPDLTISALDSAAYDSVLGASTTTESANASVCAVPGTSGAFVVRYGAGSSPGFFYNVGTANLTSGVMSFGSPVTATGWTSSQGYARMSQSSANTILITGGSSVNSAKARGLTVNVGGLTVTEGTVYSSSSAFFRLNVEFWRYATDKFYAVTWNNTNIALTRVELDSTTLAITYTDSVWISGDTTVSSTLEFTNTESGAVLGADSGAVRFVAMQNNGGWYDMKFWDGDPATSMTKTALDTQKWYLSQGFNDIYMGARAGSGGNDVVIAGMTSNDTSAAPGTPYNWIFLAYVEMPT